MESNWSVSHPSQVFVPGDQSTSLVDIDGARQDILSTSMITRRIQTTHLYQLIQCYLSPREYLRFMNTNQKDFMGIKQETICYRIIGRDNLPLIQRQSITINDEWKINYIFPVSGYYFESYSLSFFL